MDSFYHYCFIEIPILNANSVDHNQTLHQTSHQGLHCLPMSLLWDSRHKWIKLTWYNRYSEAIPAELQPWDNIGIAHCFSCINICRVPKKLFEHEAARSSVQISSEGPGKCYCNEITMDDRYSCITYDSNRELWRKLHINSSNATVKPRWQLV